jgi:hypothetical protein
MIGKHPESSSEERIGKLVSWKRHEQPPLGFFEFLPDRILNRIEMIEGCRRQPWWMQWLGICESQPVILGVIGVGVVGLFMLGLTLSDWVVHQPTRPAMAAYQFGMPAEVNSEQQKTYQHTTIAAINSIGSALSAASPTVYTGTAGLPVQPISFFVNH